MVENEKVCIYFGTRPQTETAIKNVFECFNMKKTTCNLIIIIREVYNATSVQ